MNKTMKDYLKGIFIRLDGTKEKGLEVEYTCDTEGFAIGIATLLSAFSDDKTECALIISLITDYIDEVFRIYKGAEALERRMN